VVETARGCSLARGPRIVRILCRTLPLTLTAPAVVACLEPSASLATEVQSIIYRTVPPHGRMIPVGSPRGDAGAMHTFWKAEVRRGLSARWVA
jgi:hypothetical protein